MADEIRKWIECNLSQYNEKKDSILWSLPPWCCLMIFKRCAQKKKWSKCFSWWLILFHLYHHDFPPNPKTLIFSFYISYFKKLLISSPRSIGKGGTPQSPKKAINKGNVNKVLGLHLLMKKENELNPIWFKIMKRTIPFFDPSHPDAADPCRLWSLP